MKYVPDSLRDHPVAAALMADHLARIAAQPQRVVICESTGDWAQRIEGAKWLDAYAVGNHGQGDRDFHLCCEQRYQHRDGFRLYEIGSWIGGGAVRDTMNDGDGTAFGGRYNPGATWAECLAWARAWHAEKPTHRKVILGFWWNDALGRAMTLADLEANPNYTGVRKS